MDKWILSEIMDGLSKLLCLGLDRTPASDMMISDGIGGTRFSASTTAKRPA